MLVLVLVLFAVFLVPLFAAFLAVFLVPLFAGLVWRFWSHFGGTAGKAK